MKPEKSYLKIGEYVPEDKENGTLEVINRDYYRQGWIFKDEEAYLDEEHPNRVCYIPELSDSLYTRKDFLDMCKNQTDFADELFYGSDWQHPESLMQDWIVNNEWVECPHCGSLINYGDGFNDTKCPKCGREYVEDDTNNTVGGLEDEPWYTENWYMEDLKNALESAEVEVTEENLKKLLKECKNVFDDKTMRNEMLADKARELFREE